MTPFPFFLFRFPLFSPANMMDEAYDPKHKASSVTSTTSTSTNGTAPSLFSGTSSVGGGDIDDFSAIEGN